MSGECNLCGEKVDDVLDHLRVVHPEQYGDGSERWPDGGLVIVDRTDDWGTE